MAGATSYARVEDVAASWERYEHFAAALEAAAPNGLILHVAGRTDEGFRIIEIWDSEEAWLSFAERLATEASTELARVFRALYAEHVVYGALTTRATQGGHHA
jgi:hypothetical protein